MKKEIRRAFGKRIYLLGINQEGKKEWLEEPSWDCNWYWGFGYIETYTNNKNPEKSRDISMHTHFDSLFLNKNSNCFDAFKKHYKETTLSDNEIWMLLELMNTFYMCKQWAAVLHCNGSHITESRLKTLKNNEEWERINKIVIPEITQRIIELLGGE